MMGIEKVSKMKKMVKRQRNIQDDMQKVFSELR